MSWINPPAAVRRFSLQQILQHGAASVLGLFLAASALLPEPLARLHPVAGVAAAALLGIHLFSLLAIGVRHDVAVEHIAFLPFVPGAVEMGEDSGKYSRAEKWDYFLFLLLSSTAVGSGLALEWPDKAGIGGPLSFSWLRIVHAGCGAAFLLHLFGTHIPARFLRAGAERWAIFHGKVPLGFAESRRGWVHDLVATGVLVPVPVEQEPESQKETAQVRSLLEEGNRLVREGRFDEAADVFGRALELYPEYSQARFNLAVARLRQGRNDLAGEQFRLFLEADPFNPMAGKARELLDGIRRGEKEQGL